MKKINKQYQDLIIQAENALGRKETIHFIHKAAKLKSKFETKAVA